MVCVFVWCFMFVWCVCYWSALISLMVVLHSASRNIVLLSFFVLFVITSL